MPFCDTCNAGARHDRTTFKIVRENNDHKQNSFLPTPLHSLSPTQQDLLELRRTRLLPCLHPHSDARRHASNTWPGYLWADIYSWFLIRDSGPKIHNAMTRYVVWYESLTSEYKEPSGRKCFARGKSLGDSNEASTTEKVCLFLRELASHFYSPGAVSTSWWALTPLKTRPIKPNFPVTPHTEPDFTSRVLLSRHHEATRCRKSRVRASQMHPFDFSANHLALLLLMQGGATEWAVPLPFPTRWALLAVFLPKHSNSVTPLRHLCSICLHNLGFPTARSQLHRRPLDLKF